jgi:nucleoside-diphosphate-sugar epimerase
VTIGEAARVVMKVCGRNDLAFQRFRKRPGDVHVLKADTRRASEVLNYRAEIAFEDGVKRYVEWFRKRYPDPSLLLEDRIENWQMPASEPMQGRA